MGRALTPCAGQQAPPLDFGLSHVTCIGHHEGRGFNEWPHTGTCSLAMLPCPSWPAGDEKQVQLSGCPLCPRNSQHRSAPLLIPEHEWIQPRSAELPSWTPAHSRCTSSTHLPFSWRWGSVVVCYAALSCQKLTDTPSKRWSQDLCSSLLTLPSMNLSHNTVFTVVLVIICIHDEV